MIILTTYRGKRACVDTTIYVVCIFVWSKIGTVHDNIAICYCKFKSNVIPIYDNHCLIKINRFVGMSQFKTYL